MTNNPNPKRKRGNTIATRTRKRGISTATRTHKRGINTATRMRKRGTTAQAPISRSRVGLGCHYLPRELGTAAGDIKAFEQDVLMSLQELAG